MQAHLTREAVSTVGEKAGLESNEPVPIPALQLTCAGYVTSRASVSPSVKADTCECLPHRVIAEMFKQDDTGKQEARAISGIY